MITTAERYHDISCGHRVHGHESKCAFIHGHNYRIHFTIEKTDGRLDSVGRVLDFAHIKNALCMWLEDNWDHKFLAWHEDIVMQRISAALVDGSNMLREGFHNVHHAEPHAVLEASIVWVPFNPTAENMAAHLLNVVGPAQLSPYDTRLVRVRIEETRKCSATVEL